MTLGQPDETSFIGRQRNAVWSYNFQNIECQWFQVPFGSDARTTGAGVRTLTPACLAGGGGP